MTPPSPPPNPLAAEVTRQRLSFQSAAAHWAMAVLVAASLFLLALGYVFYSLFMGSGGEVTVVSTGSSSVSSLTISTKVLFLSPFVFGLYFTTANYKKARKYRDKYVVKEVAAKTVPYALRLLHAEFPDSPAERLQFALRNLQMVYDDPVPPKKRSYNIGVNKFFRLGWQEDDTAAAEQVVSKTVPQPVKRSLGKKL